LIMICYILTLQCHGAFIPYSLQERGHLNIKYWKCNTLLQIQ
jgi:hypothetical protein